MTRQALLAHNGLRGQKDKRQKRKKEKLKKARISSQNESVVELKDQKENNPIIISSSSDSEIEIIHSRTKSSDSDDTIFLYECRGRKRKKLKKPINYWGVRNGKFYGTLDTSSEY